MSAFDDPFSAVSPARRVDPEAGWPYGDETGPPYEDAQRELRQGYSSELLIDPTELNVRPAEVLCSLCFCFHRKGVPCS